MSYMPKPITRTDKYLAYIAGNMDVALPDHPITRKEHYLAAWAEKSGFEDVDVTGEPPLTLENTIGKPLKGLRIYGKSKQVTTTGAQLLDLSDLIGKTETKNGATYKINEDQSISVSGTPTEYTSFYLKAMSLKAGSYYFLNNSDDHKVFVQLIGAKANMNNGFTLDEDVDGIGVYIIFNVASNNTQLFNFTFTSMLNAGDVVLPWEPYTGGLPSPSPDYPQEIKSVVNPTVKVTNEDGLKVQSVTFNNITLNAIPVPSGGNVTINGQQYIADYVDVEREKLVKKLKSFTISDIETISTWGINENADNITGFYFYTSENGLPKTNNDVMTSTILRHVGGTWGGKNVGCAMSSDSYNNYAILSVPTNMLEDISSDENACASLVKICENTNAIFFYSMASPIETPLTSDQLAAYKQLHTYKGTTIIDNDAGAYMSVRYEKMK